MKFKTLILVRHAKSSWKYNLPDNLRPLKSSGFVDANLVSEALRSKNYIIDKVYSSHANRAYSTCKIFKKQLSWNENLIEINNSLYDFSGESVLQVINSLNDNYNTVVLFGHNHAFTSLVNILGDQYIDNLPTSGLVVINFNIESWKFAKYGTTELIILPRDYRPQ